MKKFSKSIVKEFKNSFGRFVAIMAIIALGVGFLIGITQTTPDMKTSMSDYLRSSYAYDIDVKGTYGLTQSDIDSLTTLKDDGGNTVVEAYMPVISTYVMGSCNGSSQYAINMVGYDFSLIGSSYGDLSNLNLFEITEGEMPSAAGEVLVVQTNNHFEDVKVGDTITLAGSLTSSDSTYGDVYARKTFTVTGIVTTPDYYYSDARETTTIGTGVVGSVIIGNSADMYDLSSSSFFNLIESIRGESVVCTDLWVVTSGSDKYEMFGENYKNYVLEQASCIESLGSDICTTFNDALESSPMYGILSANGLTANASWYVLDRASCNVSYVSYDMNVEKVEDIAGVFPVFFIIVAALVALTSMTRMVEEDRLQIGTLKALGYKEGAIMSKYLIYCCLACVIGLAAGILLGFSILPTIIWNAYGTMYTLPALKLGFSWYIAISVVFGALALTILVTVFACRSTTKESPSKLMQPKAPKPGQRILLERVGFFWKHIKFKWKATIRNIFRYKKNMVLTIISVMGCTALILTGFGLGDSVDAATDIQYGDIIYYDTMVSYSGSIAEIRQEGGALAGYLDGLDSTEDGLWLDIYTESGQLTFGTSRESVDLYLIPQGSNFSGFTSLRSRKSGKALDLETDGVILPENIASVYDIDAGDTITFVTSDSLTVEFTVTGIAEYYTGSVIYMSESAYMAVSGKTAESIAHNMLLVKYGYGSDESAMEESAQLLLADSCVTGVEFTYTTISSFSALSSTMGYVVLLLVVCAGALAAIVLYNLTNINIDERRREIATLRVLGYTKWETAGYIYRESGILTVVGTLLGLLFGWLLHKYIVGRVGSVMMMFGQAISGLSYLYAILITLGFALVVWAFMLIKLFKIDMAESLKSNE
ncbi:MAG: ABC transporter permease [Clostridia bacterium]|nr:ABC transporter permease [Clostridia bacterium]